MNDTVFMSNIEMSGIVISRFISKSRFDDARKVAEDTKNFFMENKNKVSTDTLVQSVQIILYQYDEIMSKVPSSSVSFKMLSEYVNFYRE